MIGMRAILAAAILALLPSLGLAVEPDEILDDPVLEARAREISAEVRCVVCQNESIDTSNAGIARDLRILIRERLTAGDSDQQVLDFLVARYGDFVLLRPPFKPETYALWFAPFLIMVAGGAGIVTVVRRTSRRADKAAAALSDHDEAEIERLLRREQTEKKA
jgi:cytochrome c-type biogenesis protein CcmH